MAVACRAHVGVPGPPPAPTCCCPWRANRHRSDPGGCHCATTHHPHPRRAYATRYAQRPRGATPSARSPAPSSSGTDCCAPGPAARPSGVTLPLVSSSFFRMYSRSAASRTSCRLPKRSTGRSNTARLRWIERNVPRVDAHLRIHDHDALHQIPQLAHIAGPVILLEHLVAPPASVPWACGRRPW